MENISPILISMSEVVKRTSLSRTAINVHRSKNNFPKPVMLGEKRIAFVSNEIDQWIEQRIAARNAAA
jgi:prophage regulatory protein